MGGVIPVGSSEWWRGPEWVSLVVGDVGLFEG